MPVIRDELWWQGDNLGRFWRSRRTEARTLVRNLNLGALPVPIELARAKLSALPLGDEAVR